MWPTQTVLNRSATELLNCIEGPIDVTAEISITDAEESNRFEAHAADGTLAGFLEYKRTADMVVYPHTVVEPAYEGKGVGSALAQTALDDARSRGLRVLATCPFVAAWLTRHPEYQDLEYRA